MPSDPVILGFDTTAAQCAAALVSGERVLAARSERMARGHAERLLPMLEELMDEAGLDRHDLAGIGVCTGPGNFTGIRIGVAAARGLALGLGRPALGLTRFEVAAWRGAEGSVTLRLGNRLYGQIVARGHPGGPAWSQPAEGTEPEAELDPADIALCAAARLAAGPAPRPAPFYVREPDAAPPREAPPAILP